MSTSTKPILRLKDPRRFLVNKEKTRLTDEEYEYLQDNIDNTINESNTNFLPKPTKQTSIVLSEKDRAVFLVWIKSKEIAASPEAKERFRQMVDGVDF